MQFQNRCAVESLFQSRGDWVFQRLVLVAEAGHRTVGETMRPELGWGQGRAEAQAELSAHFAKEGFAKTAA